MSIPASVAKAIIAVMSEVKQFGYDERNPSANYNYTSVDKFLAKIGPLCVKAGLAILSDEVAASIELREQTNRDGKTAIVPWLIAHYEFTLVAADGETAGPYRRSICLRADGPQAFGSAQSYALKTFQRALFQIPTGEKDADECEKEDLPTAQHRPREQAKPQKQKPPAAQMTPAEWVEKCKAEIATIDTVEGIDAWENKHLPALNKLKAQSPNLRQDLGNALAARWQELSGIHNKAAE